MAWKRQSNALAKQIPLCIEKKRPTGALFLWRIQYCESVWRANYPGGRPDGKIIFRRHFDLLLNRDE